MSETLQKWIKAVGIELGIACMHIWSGSSAGTLCPIWVFCFSVSLTRALMDYAAIQRIGFGGERIHPTTESM